MIAILRASIIIITLTKAVHSETVGQRRDPIGYLARRTEGKEVHLAHSSLPHQLRSASHQYIHRVEDIIMSNPNETGTSLKEIDAVSKIAHFPTTTIIIPATDVVRAGLREIPTAFRERCDSINRLSGVQSQATRLSGQRE